jgi:hypothetical protein
VKLIEGMKEVKDLLKKADDLKSKVSKYHAALSFESPTYEDQKKQVAEWLQAHGDVVKRIEKLRLAVARTNLATQVSIEVEPGVTVSKCITAWVLRRKELAKLQATAWEVLTDKNLKEGFTAGSTGDKVEVKITRYYDPKERDLKVAALQAEPGLIDRRLEVVNAVTDLVEEVN